MDEPAARRRERKHTLLAVTVLFGGNLACLCFADGFPETTERPGDRVRPRRDTFGIHETSRHADTSLLAEGSRESQFAFPS